MKQIIQTNYSGIDGLKIIDKPKPAVSPLSALVQVKYTPVLPYDWMTEEGNLKQMRPVKLPLTVGYAFAGVVQAVGLLRDRHLVGQNVIGVQPSGANQTYLDSRLPPFLFPVPAATTLQAAATLIGGANAAMLAVQTAAVEAGDTVLVTGASGGVGTYLIQLLKKRQARVIALASTINHDFVASLGADIVVNYEHDLAAQLHRVTPPNKIIDTVGQPQLLHLLAEMFDQFALLSLSVPDFQLRKAGQTFQFTNGTIGINGYRQLLMMLADGTLTVHIQTVYPFEKIREAQWQSKVAHSQGRILVSF